MHAKYLVVLGLILTLVLVQPALSEEIGRTPPRLSFVDGQVSFYRPGASDWVEAQINTPLAPGDELYTGSPGNLELQIGPRSFVRGWANTQIGLENHERDFLQFKVTSGYAAFDLRTLTPGNTVEVDTPNAAFTINNPGYYRVNVDGERTSFTTRKGGSAVATPTGGESVAVAPSEELVLEGTDNPAVASYAAPEMDVWDQWNYDRTNDLVEASSARYVSPEAYGTDDLDRHGNWRVVPDYGSVWIPNGVASGWTPYSDGSWVLDPYYGWTWVDRAPWGWAPYHYGRWVQVNSYWAWAPGPMVARPVYAPALVAFMGGPGLSVSVSIGSAPTVGWVPLGWGEPCVPWWGRPGFIHRPWWGGWGGPRVVNDVVVHHHRPVHIDQIHHYHHMRQGRGIMAVQEQHFGRGPIRPMHVNNVNSKHLKLHHAISTKHATPASFAPFDRKGHRPPQESFHRSVVATRRPHVESQHGRPDMKGPRKGPGRIDAPMSRIVAPSRRGREVNSLKRPSFGQSENERPSPQRDHHQPPGIEQRDLRDDARPRSSERPATEMSGDRPNGRDRSPEILQRPQRAPGQEAKQTPDLPGRPANNLSPRSRERFKTRDAEPDQSPLKRQENIFQHQQRNEQQPRIAPNRPPQKPSGQQRILQQRNEQQPRIAPGRQIQKPSGNGGNGQQRIFQQRNEQQPRIAPGRPTQTPSGNGGNGQQRIFQQRNEQQPRIAPNRPPQTPSGNGGNGQQRIFQQRNEQQAPNGNRSFQRNESRQEGRPNGRMFREL